MFLHVCLINPIYDNTDYNKNHNLNVLEKYGFKSNSKKVWRL